MTDIVERIEAALICRPIPPELLREAADEIKALLTIDPPDADHMMDKIHRQRAAMDHMRLENAVLRGALLAIVEWETPHPGFGWENGSNGERDHFRAVARRALENKT
jgi:hypothetical protein